MNENKISGKHTLVEEGTEFKGTLSSKCPIVVVGKVEGEVTGPSIHVAPSGVVAGTVKVKELRSEGELAGDVEADAVRISGRVRDQTVIRAKSLEVSLTTSGVQVVFGDCELAVGDAPDKAAAIAAATAPPEKPAAATAASVAPGAQAQNRRRGQSEASWDEAGAATTNAPKVEGPDAPRRKTGTLPPPT
jgi:cytoskeletal protein CcmA (bactofilin family)